MLDHLFTACEPRQFHQLKAYVYVRYYRAWFVQLWHTSKNNPTKWTKEINIWHEGFVDSGKLNWCLQVWHPGEAISLTLQWCLPKLSLRGGLTLTESVSAAVCVQPPLSGTCVLFCASVFFLCLLMFSLTLAHFTCILTWNGTKWHQMHFIISSPGIDDILVLNTPPHTAISSLTQHLTLTLQSAPSHNIRVAISWPWHWLVILLATKSTRLRVVKVDLIRNK